MTTAPNTPKTGQEIREAFLSFFEARGHRRVRSSALVPSHDPTLLFTNAGMVQFKDVFTGKETRDYRRAVSAQKCVRAGGKHNDLENVGRTARHHTFFEMLGNFSFGDYFKEEAIAWAWEFLTQVLGLPAERLAVTVFAGDDEVPADEEAAEFWRKTSGLPEERILRLGAADNFWMMGETGPCGPCSEVHWFHGDDLPCEEEAAGRECLGVSCDCDRWVEIWNLVFMQFDRDESGQLSPLPRPSIDTGAGLERLAAVVQGKRTNYDSDLIQSILAVVGEVAGKPYGDATEDEQMAMRVIADHCRAISFLVADGVLPSNEGRGYVLRRILRRAVRYGTRLGLDRPFLSGICAAVVEQMEGAYPELRENATLIQEVAKNEEESFRRTLHRGLALLQSEFASRREGDRILPGEVVFRLYDTYGFPADLTELIAREEGFHIDEAAFLRLLDEQRARSAFAGSGETAVGDLYLRLAGRFGETRFLGYEGDGLSGRGKVLALLSGGAEVESAQAGDEVEIILDQTPFYGESGGQIGDTGALSGPGIDGARGELRIDVRDTQKPAGGLIVHKGVVRSGTVRVGETLDAWVDGERRSAIRRNHSATHLVHQVLKEVLGSHVKQAGSVVAPDYLRFDFTHFQAPTPEQLQEVEAQVNARIQDNFTVSTEEQSLEEARASGAVALFGEKYDERVRVVQVHPSSRELCGGTHVERSGDIGLFRISSESSIAAGVRRIVALTGPEAIAWTQERDRQLQGAAATLRCAPDEVVEKIEAAQRRQRELEKELVALQRRLAGSRADEMLSEVRKIGELSVLATTAEGPAKDLRELADKMRDKLGSGVVALGAEHEGKALLLVAVTPDWVAKGLHAGKLVGEMAAEVGGRGGGRPDLAQAGGAQPEGIPKALEVLVERLEASVASA